MRIIIGHWSLVSTMLSFVPDAVGFRSSTQPTVWSLFTDALVTVMYPDVKTW